MGVVGWAMAAAEAVPVVHCVGAPVGGVGAAARAAAARVAARVATWVAAAAGGEDAVEATTAVVEARAAAARVVASYASAASRQRASSGYGWIWVWPRGPPRRRSAPHRRPVGLPRSRGWRRRFPSPNKGRSTRTHARCPCCWYLPRRRRRRRPAARRRRLMTRIGHPGGHLSRRGLPSAPSACLPSTRKRAPSWAGRGGTRGVEGAPETPAEAGWEAGWAAATVVVQRAAAARGREAAVREAAARAMAARERA